jgi:type I restriction enzyme, S subunit
VTKFSDYCDVMMGQAPTGDTYNTEGNGLPLLAGASDLGDVTPVATRWTSAPTQVCEKGDLILCIRATIGDRNWADRQYCLGRGVAGLRAKPNRLEPRYLWHWIAASTPTLMHAARGATFLQVGRRDIENLPCSPPPSLAEQRRIADILDKADAIRRKRKKAIALTEELLRSAFLEMFGDPVTNPKGWPVKPMGDVVDRLDAGWSANGDARKRTKDEYGVLKVSAVTSGTFRPEEHKAVPSSTVDRELVTPRRGDLLFSRANTRELVAATCLVERDDPQLFLPDKLWRVVPRTEVSTAPYLRFLLAHDRFRSELTKTATGTSGSMLNVSMEKFRGLRTPCPPIVLQNEFATVVWRSLGAKARQQRACELTEDLFGSLIAQAFSGAVGA